MQWPAVKIEGRTFGGDRVLSIPIPRAGVNEDGFFENRVRLAEIE